MKNLYLSLVFSIILNSIIYSQGGWYWQNPLPQGNDLYDVCISPNLSVIVGDYGTLLTDYGNAWYERNTSTKETLFSVCINGYNIWAVGTNPLANK